LFVHTLE